VPVAVEPVVPETTPPSGSFLGATKPTATIKKGTISLASLSSLAQNPALTRNQATVAAPTSSPDNMQQPTSSPDNVQQPTDDADNLDAELDVNDLLGELNNFTNDPRNVEQQQQQPIAIQQPTQIEEQNAPTEVEPQQQQQQQETTYEIPPRKNAGFLFLVLLFFFKLSFRNVLIQFLSVGNYVKIKKVVSISLMFQTKRHLGIIR
jgi:hypothetical protein